MGDNAKDPTHGGVLLAKAWQHDKHDPTGWWMSEKLDGVRAYWNGRELVSRTGKTFHAPEWFTRHLPRHMPLDGELFSGRGRFNQTVSAVRKKVPKDFEWFGIAFLVFDAPDVPRAFEERLLFACGALQDMEKAWDKDRDLPNVEFPFAMLQQEKCTSPKHLHEFQSAVARAGAEGTMLRAPGSDYERKRSGTLLKVKYFQDDEAEVYAHQPGEGKHAGRLGALLCRFKDGKEFKVGSGFSDAQRDAADKLYPIGCVVTVRFQEKTPDGKPRFPTFVEVRDYE